MAKNSNAEDMPAWLQLYLAKHARSAPPVVDINPVGRPSRPVPAKRTTVWLTAGDRKVIDDWQEYFKELTGKSISIGETISLLARICNERLLSLGGQGAFESIADLTVELIGSGKSENSTSKTTGNK
jgi:hypothetical protein